MASGRRSGTGRRSGPIHRREVIKAALAHVVQNKVEAAYERLDLFERRRRLMDDWAAYLDAECGTRDTQRGQARRRDAGRALGRRGTVTHSTSDATCRPAPLKPVCLG